MRFKNKIVLITGASRGIGRATALAFAEEGAKIAVNYTKAKAKADMLVKEIKKIGSEGLSIKCDVSNEDQVKTMIDKVIEKFGTIDVLINNAGIVHDVPMFKKTVKQWKETLNINLIGPFLCSKYASPHLIRQKGKIVNVSSTNAVNCFSPEAADYDASKAGVITLTKDLAKELSPNVLVNAVAPGWVNTDMNADLPDDFIKEETAKIYVKRFADPKEIANAILFLASDDASFITGSVLIADGGHD